MTPLQNVTHGNLFDRVVAEIQADEAYEDHVFGVLRRWGRRAASVALDCASTVADARAAFIDGAAVLEWLDAIGDGRRFWIEAIRDLESDLRDGARLRGWWREATR